MECKMNTHKSLTPQRRIDWLSNRVECLHVIDHRKYAYDIDALGGFGSHNRVHLSFGGVQVSLLLIFKCLLKLSI